MVIKELNQVILGVIIATSFTLNLALVRYSLRRTGISFKDKLTISLAASDLIRSVFGYAMELTLQSHLNCNIVGFTISSLSYTSINHLVLMTFDRWLVVRRSNKAMRFHASVVQTSLAIFLCWMHAVFFAALPIMGLGAYSLEHDGFRCSVYWLDSDKLPRIYHILLFACFFFLPLALMTYFFISLQRTIRVSRIGVGDLFESATANAVSMLRIKAERRHAFMFFTMSLVFIVAWSPYGIISFLKAFFGSHVDTNIEMIAVIPAKASTLYNPIVVAVYDERFRKFLSNRSACPMRKAIELQSAANRSKRAVSIPVVTGENPNDIN